MIMEENTGLKNFTHITGSTVFDVTNDEIDDIFDKSYGWLYPTVTAFGLIVFLAVSFTCYHRRLATRKAREDEYAEFLRVYRPDLTLKGLSKPRATLIAFSSSTLDNPRSMKTSCNYINEGFEFSSPCDSSKTMEPNYCHNKTDANIYPNIDSELQLRNNYGNNNTYHHGNGNNMVGYYSGNLVSDMDPAHDTTIAIIHRSIEAGSHISDIDLVKHMDRGKKYGISEFEHVKNGNSDKILCDNVKSDFAQVKPEVTSSMPSLPSSLQSIPSTQRNKGSEFIYGGMSQTFITC
ncbi:hypothetical protein ACF0H5_023752 [Mactra antiquata]